MKVASEGHRMINPKAVGCSVSTMLREPKTGGKGLCLEYRVDMENERREK
jgi:hypothetical protein